MPRQLLCRFRCAALGFVLAGSCVHAPETPEPVATPATVASSPPSGGRSEPAPVPPVNEPGPARTEPLQPQEDNEQRLSKLESDLSTLRQGCDLYRLDHRRRYPDSLRLLIASDLRNYIGQDSLPCDPWGRDYWVEMRNGKGVVGSSGPDAMKGTADDVTTANVNKVAADDLVPR